MYLFGKGVYIYIRINFVIWFSYLFGLGKLGEMYGGVIFYGIFIILCIFFFIEEKEGFWVLVI